MENGNRHGSHTNHERDPLPNGVNGGAYSESKNLDKGKEIAEPRQNVRTNGLEECKREREMLTMSSSR
jgi:hypothetical protein